MSEILDVRNMPKRKAMFNQIMELEASKKPYQRIVDNYNISRRFTPKAYAKGTKNWKIASEAREEIRKIEKQIQPLVRRMSATLE